MTSRTSSRCALTALSCAAVLVLSGCGGGSDEGAASQAADAGEVANALAASSPTVGLLTLVSASAAGKAAGGTSAPCGVSADGALVAFGDSAATLVSGDTNQSLDVFMKNTRTGAIARVSTESNGVQFAGGADCLAITPDGNTVVFRTAGGGSSGLPAGETAIRVKNLTTGAVTTVNPPLATFSTTSAYLFQSISDDGLRVALIAAPTTLYLGGYETVANGPARALVRDLRSGELINLSADVPLSLNQGYYDGRLLLSPDGSRLAFATSSNVPAAGDGNGKSDVFVLNIATRAATLATADGAGAQAVVSGPPLYNPMQHLIGFLAGGKQLAFEMPADSTLGAAGAYVKDLVSGSARLVFASGTRALPPLSISDDGTQAAFDRPIYPPNAQQIDAVWLRDLRTGQERRINTTATGVQGNNNAWLARISRDGSTVTFQSNATNLVRGANISYIYEIYAKTVNAPAIGAQ